MKTMLSIIAVAAMFGFAGAGVAAAAGDMTAQEAVEVKVQLGDKENALVFLPDNLEFETGKLYKLVLHNPSAMAHYFSSEGFSRAVFTRKVQALDADGNRIAEVKGFISEIEVHPGGTAEWWFVPVKTGTFEDLRCTIKGHAEAGMVGSVTIK